MNAHADSNLELNLLCAKQQFENEHLKALLEEDTPGFWQTEAGETLAGELVIGAVPMIPDLFKYAIPAFFSLVGSSNGGPDPVLADRVARLEDLLLQQTKLLQGLAVRSGSEAPKESPPESPPV